jgi:hypothetical protein
MQFVIGYATGMIVTFLVLYTGYRRAEKHANNNDFL